MASCQAATICVEVDGGDEQLRKAIAPVPLRLPFRGQRVPFGVVAVQARRRSRGSRGDRLGRA